MASRTCSDAFTNDVFLSFKGSDTRYGFTGNLYKALSDKGIHTFIDDEKLQSGEEITPSLVKAIQESRIAITVLSINYASSSFCLDELTTILDCADRTGLLVLPVFHNVDPSDVRRWKGSYGEALAKHQERLQHNKEKLQKWKMALYRVANLSGYHFKDGAGYEYQFIGKIVERVSRKINHASLHVADHPVGLESQVLKVRRILDVGSPDAVHVIGIHGMGGVGKSTLARAVYNNLIAENFDGLCFLENVREESNKYGLKHLQSILLSKILGEKSIKLASEQEGISMIQCRLQGKKVLLILDDVDEHNQLKAIVGRPDWFGPGSRIIITTRDKQLLASHEVKITYEVEELEKKEALQLLTWKAFKTEIVDPNYVEVLNCVVTYASGLPLALEVIGSNLFGKSIEEWKSAIDQYKRIPNGRIQEILKVSFDALEDEEKSVFLDIACCFKGQTGIQDILCAHYGHNMKYHIDVLVEKYLIKLHYFDNKVTLHDLIEDMGKEIVRQESLVEPGKRSRLWSLEDIIQVLEDNTGTSKIKIISLDFPIFSNEMLEWDGKAFNKMQKLKTLIIRNCIFSEVPKCLPNSLRVLEWWGYPSHCLPFDFRPKKLAICKLPYSYITSFKLEGLPKKFVNLTVLNFDNCKCLTQIPDVSGFPNLEEFSFKCCDNLVTVHESIGFLDKLKILSAFSCGKLGSFPPIKLTSLEKLELSCCWSLENFPEILGKMENIRELRLMNSSIKELPFSFENLIGLKNLSLDYCGIVQLPCSIVMMPQLTSITASGQKEWKWLEQEEVEEKVGSIVSSKIKSLIVSHSYVYDDFFSIGFTRFAHVEYLDLSGNNFTFLPECIKDFQYLWCLNVSNCKHLQEIRGVPSNLKTFRARNCESLTSSSTNMILNQELCEAGMSKCCLAGAWIPEWFDHQSRGPSTCFWFRNEFPPNILCLLIAPVEFVNELDCPTPMVFINGRRVYEARFPIKKKTVRMAMDHTYVFKLRLKFSQYQVLLQNEWNHMKVTYAALIETSDIKATGIHVFKQESSSEDILFIDPYN